MADSYRSPTRYLFDKLSARFGTAGYALNNYRNTALWNLAGGAATCPPDGLWFCNSWSVPPGGALWWENQPTPGGVMANQAGLFYVRYPGGGSFRLMLSTNGGAWTTALTVDGFAPEPAGAFTNLFLPTNRYRLRVESDSGTNRIIGPLLVDTNATGLVAAFVDQPGISLASVTNVPLVIRAPILAALQPDLLVWHMKESDWPATSNRMAACETWWRNARPECDVLYIGTTWVSLDTNSAWTPAQNEMVRNIAIQHGRAYVDLMQPTISYDWLRTNGYMADGTHVNNAGGLLCADIMWNDLGFFALGLNRRLRVEESASQYAVSYTVTTSAVYRLEFSTNLVDWQTLLTNVPTPGVFTTNLSPVAPRGFFRLGLTPR